MTPANENQAAAAIEVRDVSKVFGAGKHKVRALDDVSVTIQRNEFFTLLGPSGCGKTTLLRLIAGFEFPSTGHILLNGTDIAPLPPYRRPVNTVFQNYALFPHMSVEQNIAFGLSMLRKPRSEIDQRVDEVLQLVRMEELRHRSTSEISGGQQQRVALARALAPSPEVLLLDEPLSALDYKLRKEMQIELKRMQHETGITFIFVTHDQEEALTMSDRIAVMSAGRILQTGTPYDIYESPADRFVASFIGETNFIEGTVLGIADGRARIALNMGGEVSAGVVDGMPEKGPVSVMVRPEHSRIIAAQDGITGSVDVSGALEGVPEGALPGALAGALAGTLEHVVYSGTDTHFHVRLADRTRFIVRTQNQGSGPVSLSEDQTVTVTIGEDAAKVLIE